MSKIILITFIIFYLMQNLSATTTTMTAIMEAPKRCTIIFRCSPYFQNLTWTISDGICRPIQNGCNLAMEDCSRINQDLEPLEVIEEEDCANFCPEFCTKIYRPVNADFPYKTDNGTDAIENLRFSNLCMLQAYSCGNARAYINWEDEWSNGKPKYGRRWGNCRRPRKY